MVVRQTHAEGGGAGQEKKIPGIGNRRRNPALKREIRSLEVRKDTQKGRVSGLVRWAGGWDVGGPKCQGAKGAELSICKKENRKHFQVARGAGMGCGSRVRGMSEAQHSGRLGPESW